MTSLVFTKSALAGLLLFGAQLLQAQVVSSTIPGSFMTTGIVGVTGAQTARLNVLNLQPVIPGVAAIACPATLEFYDDSGAQLKQLAVTNISPATAASLVFKPPVPSTAVRAQIRAVVFTPSTSTAGMGMGMGTMSPEHVPMSRGCNVMASLEIIDDATGATHTYVTDLRGMPSFMVLTMAQR